MLSLPFYRHPSRSCLPGMDPSSASSVSLESASHACWRRSANTFRRSSSTGLKEILSLSAKRSVTGLFKRFCAVLPRSANGTGKIQPGKSWPPKSRFFSRKAPLRFCRMLPACLPCLCVAITPPGCSSWTARRWGRRSLLLPNVSSNAWPATGRWCWSSKTCIGWTNPRSACSKTCSLWSGASPW